MAGSSQDVDALDLAELRQLIAALMEENARLLDELRRSEERFQLGFAEAPAEVLHAVGALLAPRRAGRARARATIGDFISAIGPSMTFSQKRRRASGSAERSRVRSSSTRS